MTYSLVFLLDHLLAGSRLIYQKAELFTKFHMQSSSNYLPRNPFKMGLGRLVLRLLGGWKIEGNLPENINKYVIIVAHHTSNWDFVVGVAIKLITRIRVRFFAKHSLFFWPLGVLMRRLGGISIERDKSINRVDQAIAEIKNSEHFVLVIAPEGTRSKVQRWKSGFYHIANGANIPVVPIAFNFRDKKVIMGSPMTMSGDLPADFANMHEFFLPHPGKHPELGCDGPFETPDIYSH